MINKRSTKKPQIKSSEIFKDTPTIVDVQPLSVESKMIYDTYTKLMLGSLDSMDEAAKQLSSLGGLVQGLLVAAFAFGNFQTIIKGWMFIVFVLALISLLASFISCSLVYMPMSKLPVSTSEVGEMERTLFRISGAKLKWLRLGQFAFVLSILCLTILFISTVVTQ